MPFRVYKIYIKKKERIVIKITQNFFIYLSPESEFCMRSWLNWECVTIHYFELLDSFHFFCFCIFIYFCFYTFLNYYHFFSFLLLNKKRKAKRAFFHLVSQIKVVWLSIFRFSACDKIYLLLLSLSLSVYFFLYFYFIW